MKNRRNRSGSDEESSEDERIIEAPLEEYREDDQGDGDDDFFENSQELTQLIPRKPEFSVKVEKDSPQKKKKRKKEREPESMTTRESLSSPDDHRSLNGYHRIREIDVSEIPDHIIANMNRVVPQESDCLLTMEAVQKAASSSDGGVWILKCPTDINLSDLLQGKKLSLDGEQSVINFENEVESAQLTQYLPTSSLGINVNNRQFEASSVISDDYKDGALLMLPDADKFKLVATPIQGHIIIRECVKKLELPEIKLPKLRPRELPVGIKERHPVYGADFTGILDEMESAPRKKRKKSHAPDPTCDFLNGTHLSIPATIIPKIEVDSEDCSRSRKKKKKKAKHRDECDSEAYTNQNGLDSSFTIPNSVDDSSSSKEKKSKKRKREELDETYEDLDKTLKFELNEPAVKKVRKSKHRSSD